MTYMKDSERLADLLREMARTMGVDFDEVLAEGRLTPAEFREAVEFCRHCERAEDCPGWVAEHPMTVRAPDHCRNKALLERLRG